MLPGFIGYNEFVSTIDFSIEKTALDFFRKNKDIIKIKSETIAQKNLISIFKATIEASNERGFQNMSMRDLSRESGLSLGGLYSYFPGKTELITMLFNYSEEMVLNIMREQTRKDFSTIEILNRLICVHLYVSEVGHDWFYFFYMETKNLSKDNQKRMIAGELKTEEIFHELLNKGTAEGVFKVDDPLFTASVIKSMLQDWYLKRFKFSRRNMSVEQYAENVIKLVGSYILNKS